MERGRPGILGKTSAAGSAGVGDKSSAHMQHSYSYCEDPITRLPEPNRYSHTAIYHAIRYYMIKAPGFKNLGNNV